MALVYIHKGLDNNEVFYVGIGKSEIRAKSKDKRNQFWHNYVNVHGFTYSIVLNDLTWEEACIEEIKLIKHYGRRHLAEGTLVNMTEGGSGGATTTGRKNPSLSAYNKAKKGQPGLKLKWLNKDGKNKRVLEDKISDLLDEGWVLGALKTGPRDHMKGIKPWNTGLSGYKVPKIREALLGKTYKKQENIACPYCDKSGILSNMKRWHFDNCKHKII